MSAEKAGFRKDVLARIQALDAAYLAESDAGILEQLCSLPEYAAAGRLFAYWSVGRECDTRALLERARRRGMPAALPVCRGRGEMDFFLWTGELVLGRLGIPEPQGGEIAFPGPGDLMAVPAVCCDAGGYRLGRGGGYYDRYLAAHPCFSVCLCRERLLAEKVPRDWNDFPVSAVITEERVLRRA